MKNIVIENVNGEMSAASFAVLEKSLSRRLAEREIGFGGEGGYKIEIVIDTGSAYANDRYTVAAAANVATLTVGNDCTAHAAVGRFLLECSFDGRGKFTPPTKYIDFTPKRPLRGMYFATHFNNFYQAAPVEQVYEVIEDLAADGCNSLLVWYDMHHFTSIDEPASLKMIERLHLFIEYANRIGMSGALIMLANEAFKSSPVELRAEYNVQGNYKRKPEGHYHVEICPSKEGGIEEILRERREVLMKFKDLDIKYAVYWPYDQGGCTCDKCAPWGVGGYLKILPEFEKLLDELMPETRIIFSTWYFDQFIDGEWDVLYEKLVNHELSDKIDYIMSFFFNGIMPDVIAEKGIPEGVKFVSFPEISMYSCRPWGGFGANPLTRFLEVTNARSGKLYDGCYPYSEGIFEDINKFISLHNASGLYEHSDDAVAAYVKYEFCVDDKKLTDAIIKTETSLARGAYNDGKYQHYDIKDTSEIEEVYETICAYDKILPEKIRHSRRWRLIYLRAVIDMELYKNEFMPLKSERAQEVFSELYNMYYSSDESLVVVRPPKGV